jgi:membrane-bound lytic murein transglycosylase D
MKLLSIILIPVSFLFLSDCNQESKSKNLSVAEADKNAIAVNFPEIPAELYFAGEKVPLEDPETRERLEKELIVNVNKHSSTLLILKRQGRWKKRVQEILKEQGVHEDFFYLAAIESEFDPYADSNKARGFWQFTDTTAREYGIEISNYVDMRVDPETATYAACRYFKKAYGNFNSWTLSAVSFNPGISAIKRFMQAQNETDFYKLYLFPETYRYVFRVLAIKIILENPGKYGYTVDDNQVYKPITGKKEVVTQSIQDLAAYAKSKGINFQTLKRYNPWIKFNRYDYKFEVPPGKSYTFLLPE